MKIDDDGNISFRQSWLSNAENCPERMRLDFLHPERSRTSDEAFIGTAAHYGIEAVIEGRCAAADIADAVRESYRNDPEAKTMYFARPKTHQSTIGECIDLSIRCAEAWVRDIMPHMPLDGARCEVPFDVPVFEHDGRIVSIKGTCDVVPATGGLWDHKTSARDYKQREKQLWNTQATVYSMADCYGGFGRTDVRPPTTFTFSVMVKLKKECRGQIVTVQRDVGHFRRLEKVMRGWVDLLDGVGYDKQWPMISDGNYLCNHWCDHYDQCRGADISKEDDLFGYVPK